jgi:ribosomal-protein-alanine N-acetyltransferase
VTVALAETQAGELGYLARLSSLSADSTLGQDALQAYRNQGALLGLYQDGTPIGFLVQKIVLDEAELIQILVDPLYCNQGLATEALMHWHRALAQLGVGQVFLEVRQSNVPAIALYKRLGYNCVGVRKNYYHYGDHLVDAWIMSLHLVPCAHPSLLAS